jgi:hypothetical protein
MNGSQGQARSKDGWKTAIEGHNAWTPARIVGHVELLADGEVRLVYFHDERGDP